MLAGTDRLDTPLNIAQMQGKFQLVLVPEAGHVIHEDEPGRTAAAVLGFLKQFRIGSSGQVAPLPPWLRAGTGAGSFDDLQSSSS